MTIQRRGFLLILSSPSGAGKTTIAQQILQRDPHLVCSVSVTTRPKRPYEIDGEDYFFVSVEKFHEMLAGNEFMEHARVFNHFYGTPRSFVENALQAGHDVLFDIDWQGMQQVRETAQQDTASIFILPPSVPELEKRLRNRAQDDDATICTRMDGALNEISHWPEYDYVIVNRDLTASVSHVEQIIAAERLRRRRQTGLVNFVRGLTQSEI